MTIRILQIGAGIRGSHWAQFVREHPDAECVAVVEPIAPPSSGSRRTVQNDACAIYTDLDEALANTAGRRRADRQPLGAARRARRSAAWRPGSRSWSKSRSAPASPRREASSTARRGAGPAGDRRRELPLLARPSARSASCCSEGLLGALDHADADRPPPHAEPHRGPVARRRSTIRSCRRSRSTTSTACAACSSAAHDPHHGAGLESALDRLPARRQHRGADRLRRACACSTSARCCPTASASRCGSRARRACSGPTADTLPGAPRAAAGSGRSATSRSRPATRSPIRRAAPPRS